MALHFCHHCGTRLQPDFNFCPSCGMKLSRETDQSCASPAYMDNNAKVDDVEKSVSRSRVKMTRQTACKVQSNSATPSSPDIEKSQSCSPEKRTRQTARKIQSKAATPSSPESESCSPVKKTRQTAQQVQSNVATPSSPGQRALASPPKRKLVVQEELCSDSPLNFSPQTSPVVKGKNGKIMGMVQPLQEGMELNDQSGVKWKLLKLLSQSDSAVMYEVQLNDMDPNCLKQNCILRMAAKDGQIFTEQNFFQRAGRTVTVEKWVKRMKLDYIGMPTCLGFGLHGTCRFLVFEDMGQSLDSIMLDEAKPLSPKVVLKLACRILDVLEFIHENEYTHADIRAENIYISSDSHPKVILSGFGRAFRFCPGGKHVEYREGSRAPHLGHHDFISLDVHLGAAPSRRSDLQSLGYCLIYWMTKALPWNSTTQKPKDIAAEKQRCMKDISRLLRHSFGTEKVPGTLLEYLSQVMNLEYSETPNYTQLKAGLTNELQQLGVALEDPLNLHI